ncbi:MAG: hypothetical protein LBH73_04865 [Spirochaetaceae bacterium]|jgi:hypothetical protein|nr:hypothetical protein [Spirochaetaceae bacterium]
MRRGCFIFLLGSFLLSCSYRELAAVSLDGKPLYALSREAALGRARLSDFKTFEYVPENPLPLYGTESLEIQYRLDLENPGGENLREESALILSSLESEFRLVLSAGEGSWVLPLSAAFLGRPGLSFSGIRYAVPLGSGELTKITLTLEAKDSGGARRGSSGGGNSSSGSPGGGNSSGGNSSGGNSRGAPDEIVFALESFKIAPLWYGVSLSGETLDATPFVYAEGDSLVIEVPEAYRPGGNYELAAGGLSGAGEFFIAGERYTYLGLPDGGDFLALPPGLLPAGPFPLGFRGKAASLEYRPGAERKFPLEAVVIDPGLILNYPRENWRNRDYEIFQWDRFPEILIFDTADYAVQDRLFKRLAFFVEKIGFRGRLAPDSEIAELHGWNAHDYRSEDLARFFDLARKNRFPLNQDEKDLENLLLARNILRENAAGDVLPGTGAIISISRESANYLRATFLAHESFHGLFFINEEFRDFSRQRWAGLDPAGKRFIVSYFEYSGYDSADQYLMINEFMAYCLQQSVSQAGEYFGKTLPSRIAEHPWRRSSLPEEDSGTWPRLASLFTAEAEAFSRFVREHFGLSAGRIQRIYKARQE